MTLSGLKKWIAFGSGVGIQIAGPRGAESLRIAAARVRKRQGRIEFEQRIELLERLRRTPMHELPIEPNRPHRPQRLVLAIRPRKHQHRNPPTHRCHGRRPEHVVVMAVAPSASLSS